MPRVGKLIPLAEYKKPLLQLQGDSEWIIQRLAGTIKETAAKAEALYDEAHMPGLSNKAARAVKAQFAKESDNVRKLNELIRHEKAMAYEEQLGRAGQAGIIGY